MFEASRPLQPATVGVRDTGPSPLAALDIQKVWTTLWLGRSTILISVAVALVLALGFISLAPHRYTAVTQILIEPIDLHAAGNDLSPVNQSNEAAVLQVESQIRVLGSDSVLRRVVMTEHLDQDPEFVRGALPYEDADVGSAMSPRASAALAALKRQIQVKRPERTYVAEVTVTSQDPAKAARIANAVAQAYLAEQTDVRSEAARQISQSLSARLRELKDRVREAEERAEKYKASNNIVGAGGQLVNEQQLAELNTRLGAARARTVQARAKLDQIESVQKSKAEIGAFPEALQSQTITALRAQYAEIQRREAEQMTSLGERHPAVIEIQAQAARLHRMIDDEVNRIAVSARGEYEAAKADEASLSRHFDSLKQTALTTNESLVALRELERDVQTSRAIYEAFLVRARETGEQERLDTKNIRVISRAAVPMSRSFPPPSLLIALAAMLLGAASGAGIVLVRPNRELTAFAQTRQHDGSHGVADAAVRMLFPSAAAAPPIPVLAALPDAGAAFALRAVEDPHSRFAGQIRRILTALPMRPGARGRTSILVASFAGDTAAGTVALSLAAVAATIGRALLIDADLDRRTLLALDADRNDAGLIDVATGRRELDDVIVRDRDSNLVLVPFVAPASRRDRRISEADIRDAFDETRRFDTVIVAAVDIDRDPSAILFAGLVDHVVLVVRADGRNADAAAQQLIARLGPDADKLRGAVTIGAERA
jgi:uncharacterized protein involved in exopolysaccharide biosynthesis/Mrp family chromosome partitioning ATPase